MNKLMTQLAAAVTLLILVIGYASAADPPDRGSASTAIVDLDRLVGQPVDIAPWAYSWRADLAVQEKPEAYFIPRRLERIDKVYRTAFGPHCPRNS